MRIKQKIIAGLVFLLVSVFIISTSYLESQRQLVARELAKFGFERTLIVNPITGAMSGADAAEYISNAPTVNDGVQAVLSRAAAAKLMAFPQVETVFVVGRSLRQIQMSNGRNLDVEVFNAPQNFLRDFNLDSTALLRPSWYTASESLREFFEKSGRSSASIGVPAEQINSLPEGVRDQIDWTKAKAPINISDHFVFGVGKSQLFRNTVFTTGKEAELTIPGVYIIPRVDLFVQIKRSDNVPAMMREVRAFLETAVPAYPKSVLVISTMDQYFAEELGLARVEKWTKGIQTFLMLATLVLFASIILTKYQVIANELALRRILGAPKFECAWYSIRPVVMATFVGCVIAIVMGLPVHYYLFNSNFTEFVIAGLGPVIVIVVFCVFIFIAAYVYAKNFLLLSKHG